MSTTKHKYFWMAVTEEENGKYFSHAWRFSENDNIKSVLATFKNLAYANVMPTKKRAVEVARYWNECHKKNGTYMFDDAPLF